MYNVYWRKAKMYECVDRIHQFLSQQVYDVDKLQNDENTKKKKKNKCFSNLKCLIKNCKLTTHVNSKIIRLLFQYNSVL